MFTQNDIKRILASLVNSDTQGTRDPKLVEEFIDALNSQDGDSGGSDFGEGVKMYLALVSQNGSSDPAALVLLNTLGGTPVYTRQSPGLYFLTLAGAFPVNKTFILLGSSSDPDATKQIMAGRGNDDRIEIASREVDNTPLDGLMVTLPIFVLVFP